MKCDRCEQEAEHGLFVLKLPIVTASRDDLWQAEIVERKICRKCVRSLSRWWLLCKIERNLGGS